MVAIVNFSICPRHFDFLFQDMMKGLKPPLTGENLFVYLCSWPQYWMNETNTIECKDTAVCAYVGDGTGNFTGYGYQHYAYYDTSNNTVKIFFRGTYRYTFSDRGILLTEHSITLTIGEYCESESKI